jgi:hypothetical protein
MRKTPEGAAGKGVFLKEASQLAVCNRLHVDRFSDVDYILNSSERPGAVEG